MSKTTKTQKNYRRARRVRAVVKGTAERPRLSVKRSLRHIYAQIINDESGVTIVSASDKDVDTKGKRPVEIAKEVGLLIGEKAKTAQVTTVVFDRGPNRYHGRVAAVADGAREAGLSL